MEAEVDEFENHGIQVRITELHPDDNLFTISVVGLVGYFDPKPSSIKGYFRGLFLTKKGVYYFWAVRYEEI